MMIIVMYVCMLFSSVFVLLISLPQEIQTSNFIAQALNGGNISAKYIPVITVVIGFFMAYCTGSVSNIILATTRISVTMHARTQE